jgi:NAD(P)-dependent dehydrogenase (short-subunit alcohol dehydrogenase family)
VAGLLQDRVCVVTGGAGGLGRGYVEALLREGARVVYTDLDRDGLEEFTADLGKRDDAAPFRADITDDADVKRLMDFVRERFGGIDAIVNNAGWGGGRAPVHELSDDIYQKTMDVNVKSILLTSRHAIPTMIEQGRGGAIVNVTSIQASVPAPSMWAYSAAKGAVWAATRQMAVEYGRYGIRTNCISLSANLHHRNQHIWPDERKALYLPHFPLGRFGVPRDVADAAVYLLSDMSSFVTGQQIQVDGGYTVQGPATPSAWKPEYVGLVKQLPTAD